MPALTLILLAALLLGQAPASPPPPAPAAALSALTLYAGSWLVTPTPAPGTPPATDHLTNHCHMVDAFYTCEQVVNGKPAALLVFVATATTGAFHSQAVLPDGHATGRTDLTIDAGHWTYLTKDTEGAVTTTYRVENYFKDRDHIHYEMYKSTDAATWQKTGAGDEVRVPTP